MDHVRTLYLCVPQAEAVQLGIYLAAALPPPSIGLPPAFLCLVGTLSAVHTACHLGTTLLGYLSAIAGAEAQETVVVRQAWHSQAFEHARRTRAANLVFSVANVSLGPRALEARECAPSQRLRSALLATTPLRPTTTSTVRTRAADAMVANKVPCESIPRPQSGHANNTC